MSKELPDTVGDFYSSETEYLKTLDNADFSALTDQEMGFVAGLRDKFSQYRLNAFLSEKQNNWLSRLAER